MSFEPQTKRMIHRTDYKAPQFLVKNVSLAFDLDYEKTIVRARLTIIRDSQTPHGADLTMDGDQGLELTKISLVKDSQERELSYAVVDSVSQRDMLADRDVLKSDTQLRIKGSLFPEDAQEPFELSTEVSINPSTNTALSGLYKAGPLLCTQCEAEGFRAITYFIDRPDVMAKYNVRLESSASTFPVLLSNGNRVEEGSLPEGRHYVVYDDPFPKPSYLFAVVAGDMAYLKDTFMRKTGEPVDLFLWCEPKEKDKLVWALQCLKKAMRWDEERYGLVYDLKCFNLVATPFFNQGAMENKSLNIFNADCLLASPETSTDFDFIGVLGCVGHEYFHNWTGNRVTCRDWFQLTLKEGLTVFRDQEFQMDVTSRSVKRINTVNSLKTYQFSEDAGPMAHSIRPDQFEEIENFYSSTVYSKGAEVVRMYQTILGMKGFRKGMDLYFQRHDGQAVTCDDFCAAMADANGVNLDRFKNWYSQVGTPVLRVEQTSYDPSSHRFTFKLSQSIPRAGLSAPVLHIPVSVGLIGKRSKREIFPTKVFNLTEAEAEFVIDEIKEEPVMSILRGFSAPVNVEYANRGSSEIDVELLEEWGYLMNYDVDEFNRHQASRNIIKFWLLQRAKEISNGKGAEFPISDKGKCAQTLIIQGLRKFLEAVQKDNELQSIGAETQCDKYYAALFFQLPSVTSLMNEMNPVDPVALYTARKELRCLLYETLRADMLTVYETLCDELKGKPYSAEFQAVGARELRNTLLFYVSDCHPNLPRLQYSQGSNMTDWSAALASMANNPSVETEEAFEDFLLYKARDDLQVIDKWFALQARADRKDVLDKVRELRKHPRFDITNPNTVRALIGGFVRNEAHFHAASGEGYEFFCQFLADLDPVNGRLAARMTTLLDYCHRLEPKRRGLLKEQLTKLSEKPLSSFVREVVDKILKEGGS